MRIKHMLLGMLLALVDPLVGLFRIAMRVCKAPMTALPRVLHHAQHFQQERGYGKVLAGGRGFAVGIAVLALLVIGSALLGHLAAGALLAVAPTATSRDLKTILKEMTELQEKWRGKNMPQAEGEKYEALAAEGKEYQDAAEREKQLKNLERFSREVPDPILPGREDNAKEYEAPTDIVGYMSIGEAFTSSPEYKAAEAAGFPLGYATQAIFEGAAHLNSPGYDGARGIKAGFVPITRKQADAVPQLKALIERKAIPTVGATVVQVDRDPEFVRATEQTRLSIRDLLNVSPTSSNSIDYVVLTSYTRAALAVADTVAKPEATAVLGTGTAPVRTLAVHMPVTVQQLQDVPQIQNIIEGELRWDLKKYEEEQICWGPGTGQTLLGIFATPGVAAGRTVGGDTFIDLIRRAATDVRIAGLEPNGVAIHPLDWETVELSKGTDSRYVWAVIRDVLGARIWGMPVAETVAMAEPGTYTTNERRFLVGDFRRGATLWDRMQASVAIGMINDQFIKNMRTILDEERVAFGVKRPLAFKYRITQARVP